MQNPTLAAILCLECLTESFSINKISHSVKQTRAKTMVKQFFSQHKHPPAAKKKFLC